MKVLAVYCSMYGHIYRVMSAVMEGIRSVPGAEVLLHRAPETLPPEVLE